jgi:hypothetical protein
MQTVMNDAPKSSRKDEGGFSSASSIFPAGYMFTFLLTTMIFFVWGFGSRLS